MGNYGSHIYYKIVKKIIFFSQFFSFQNQSEEIPKI